MGVLNESDWKAGWIAWSRSNIASGPLPMFRKEFTAKRKPVRATVSVSGLGFFELYLNGRKVGDNVLDPGWTNYRQTALYVTHEVETLLHAGPNAIGVMLGNGMFNVAGGRYVKFNASFGQPRFILHLRLEYEDGSVETVASDTRWKASASPITFSCIYGGEDYDAQREQTGWDQPGFNDSTWEPVRRIDSPLAFLTPQTAPPIRVAEPFRTVKMTEPAPGVRVYDLGQNFAGWPRITVRGARGTTVRLTPGELLDAKGLVSQVSSGGPTYFTYSLKGEGTESWHPRFTYYGFRYVQVEGSAEVLGMEGQFVTSSVPRIGKFECSNPLFNRIGTLIDAAVRSNMQSVMTDCPHREKLGWLEQTYLMGPSVAAVYDLSTFGPKIVRDMREAQTVDGLVPDIAPEYTQFGHGFRDSPEWGSAIVQVPWLVYQRYGDLRVLEESYASMKRYVEYLAGKSKDDILSYGLGDWYDIGPGGPGASKLTPFGVTATATYYSNLVILEKVARLLDHQSEAAAYAASARRVNEAFHKSFYDPLRKQYGSGSQTAYAMPLVLGMTPASDMAQVRQNLLKDVVSRGNQQTAGDIGYHYLVRALLDGGGSEVLYAMTNRTEAPSYAAQLSHGATALTEAWDANPRSSQNHLMLGHINEWFYAGLAGIEAGFDRIVIKPRMVGDLTWVKAEQETARGRIESRWTRIGADFELTVRIPANSNALVFVPGKSAAAEQKGVRFIRQEQEFTVFEVSSGSYTFSGKK
jgi:hypothetical protein